MAGRGYCVALVIFVIAVLIVAIVSGCATGCIEWCSYDHDTSRSSFMRGVSSACR
ncbi:uncharacterized protein LAESUDRAFT_730697 [Laetiporus sulphureus 93-53]|uniref:Uncharacterized protein n=1 Tax=Laetiporus sulphureus 93-53 TaxID=1314785 RepID=A0A165C0P1_9APHY|nr:uncharacterized protein LAESUDRAFT_730697 [Laetiporus sulphureus 93-53]KZT01988.1 hypothetical protein LAESUDRAFT_730697 [Laetiporus sulphureus 93-53]